MWTNSKKNKHDLKKDIRNKLHLWVLILHILYLTLKRGTNMGVYFVVDMGRGDAIHICLWKYSEYCNFGPYIKHVRTYSPSKLFVKNI